MMILYTSQKKAPNTYKVNNQSVTNNTTVKYQDFPMNLTIKSNNINKSQKEVNTNKIYKNYNTIHNTVTMFAPTIKPIDYNLNNEMEDLDLGISALDQIKKSKKESNIYEQTPKNEPYEYNKKVNNSGLPTLKTNKTIINFITSHRKSKLSNKIQYKKIHKK